jgi:hypothetical protein
LCLSFLFENKSLAVIDKRITGSYCLSQRRHPNRRTGETIMERIELVEHAKKAYRWVGDKALPIAWNDALRRLALGLARRVYQ